jgi:hypothetical protein
MFTVILSDESVNFFTFSLIYLCKSESQKVFAQFTDVTVIRFIAKQTVLGNNSLLLFVYTILNPLYYKRRRGCKGEL